MNLNYICSEFLLEEATFAITDNLTKFGNGLGCYIVNKIKTPHLPWSEAFELIWTVEGKSFV